MRANQLGLKHGDIVVLSGGGGHSYLACVLSQGPKTFDIVVTGGGTERHRHGKREVRLATIADFNGDMERTTRTLRKDATDAREGRRTGAGIKRGVLWPSH